jgi:hypothetical protein
MLLAGVGRPSASQSNGNLEEDLRHSQMCAKAAREFRNQPEWKNEAAGPFNFTSHFNKKLGKCLVKVTSSHVVSGGILETQHVYDAFEGTVLGGQIEVKKLQQGQEPKVESIVMVRDGETLGKDKLEEAREAYAWFQTLMSD